MAAVNPPTLEIYKLERLFLSGIPVPRMVQGLGRLTFFHRLLGQRIAVDNLLLLQSQYDFMPEGQRPIRIQGPAMQSVVNTISGAFDFELHRRTERTVQYSIALPEGGPFGLVVYIAGFAMDASSAYLERFQKFMVEEYAMACMLVSYHCCHSRPQSGATIHFCGDTMRMLEGFYNVPGGADINAFMHTINSILDRTKRELNIPGLLIPKLGEYQNFGLMPAIDHVLAIRDALERYPIDRSRIYAIGSSYGGFIANLISKIAPRTLTAVFDNSSWAEPNPAYVTGHENAIPEFIMKFTDRISLHLNTLSPWTANESLPNHFCQGRKEIRSFPIEHLSIMKENGHLKTQYRFVHAADDPIANTQDKIRMTQSLMELGYNAQMEIYDQSDIDGKFIKNIRHGLGLSMQTFFRLCHEHVSPAECTETDFDYDHEISYPCHNYTYSFLYKGGALEYTVFHRGEEGGHNCPEP